jgi:hypothetical protein
MSDGPNLQTSDNFPKVVTIIATIGVAVGLAAMPYGYYMLLRFVLCGASVYLLLGVGLELVHWQQWVLGAFAVLYNPFLPVRLGDKGIWTVLNILTIVLFWSLLLRSRR